MRRALGVALLLTACHYRANGVREVVNWEDRLRKLASFQLECASDELEVIDLERGNVAGVVGCGKRETYVYDHGQSQWSRSSDGQTVIEESAFPARWRR